MSEKLDEAVNTIERLLNRRHQGWDKQDIDTLFHHAPALLRAARERSQIQKHLQDALARERKGLVPLVTERDALRSRVEELEGLLRTCSCGLNPGGGTGGV